MAMEKHFGLRRNGVFFNRAAKASSFPSTTSSIHQHSQFFSLYVPVLKVTQ